MPGEGEPVVRRCKRCKIIFNIMPDEQAWWHERGLYLPSHCKDCRVERRKEKEAEEEKRRQKPEKKDEGIVTIEFDAELFEYHQDGMEVLGRVFQELKSIPIERLTTFADLDKLFGAVDEATTSAQLLGIIPSDADAKEEEEEAAEEKSAEISEEPLESSPQTTEAPEAQDEMPSPSLTMEAEAS